MKKVNRIVMFGEVYGTNGLPVMAVLELVPTDKNGVELDHIVVASSYTRERNIDERLAKHTKIIDDTQRIIDHYRLLYIDPNKKRTMNWAAVNRLQLPLGFTQFGSINNVSYYHQDVKEKASENFDGQSDSVFQQQLRKMSLAIYCSTHPY